MVFLRSDRRALCRIEHDEAIPNPVSRPHRELNEGRWLISSPQDYICSRQFKLHSSRRVGTVTKQRSIIVQSSTIGRWYRCCDLSIRRHRR